MPPKSVKSMKSTSEKGGKGKDNKDTDKENAKKKDKFPVSKADYTQPVIVKNSKVSFGEKLEQAKGQHKDKLEELIFEMDTVKRENDRLRRQQEDTFGVSIDTVDRMKKELERARTTRMFLLEDIEIRKTKSEKMEAEIFELNMKLESFTKKINELTKMRGEWEEMSEKLTKTEDKCERLAKVNKNLRLLMSKHHIDPKSVDFDSGRSKKSSKSDTRVPMKPILKPGGAKKKPDAHTQSHNHAASLGYGPKKSRSLTDLRDEETSLKDEVKRRAAITSRKALGRGPPSYLGYYSDIHQNRLIGRNRIERVHLPSLVAV